jgi:hypothetical protein
MSETDFPKLAYSIAELANRGPIRRSSIYNQIAAGRLRAGKIGRRTIVLDEDWRAFLANTPAVAPAKRAGEPSAATAPPPPRGRPPRIAVNALMEPVEARTESTATAAKVQVSHTPDETGAGS